MKIIPMNSSEGLQEAAACILHKVLNDPAKREVLKQLFEDETVTKDQFFVTAFAMGASSALAEIMEGNVVMVNAETAGAQGNS